MEFAVELQLALLENSPKIAKLIEVLAILAKVL